MFYAVNIYNLIMHDCKIIYSFLLLSVICYVVRINNCNYLQVVKLKYYR